MKKLFFLSCIFFVAACSSEKTDEELLELDRAALNENLLSGKVVPYKFVKLMFRAYASDDTTSVQFKGFKKESDALVMKMMELDHADELGVRDYWTMYRLYTKMDDFVTKTDEDQYPVIVDAFGRYWDGRKSSRFFKNKAKLEQEAKEHAFLTILAMASSSLGTEIALYECAETDLDQLPDSELKSDLRFLRAFVFLQKGFYYLSEKEHTDNLEWLKKNKQADLRYTINMLHLGHFNKEESFIAYRAMNHVYRGIDRLMMKREKDHKRALEDFEQVLKDCKTLKIDNELIWTIDVYVQLEKGNKKQAIISLNRLKKSKLLNEDDKQLIDESISYLEKDDSEKVSKELYDRIFMTKVAGSFMFNRLKEVNANKFIKGSHVPNASGIARKTALLEKAVDQMERFSNGETLNEAAGEAGAEGKNLLDKAGELLPEF